MKCNLSVLVLATCSAVSAVTLLQTTSGKHSLTADRVPPPPWPKSFGTLVADGVPPPPWPKLSDVLLVDGVPPPPWPPKGNGMDDSRIV